MIAGLFLLVVGLIKAGWRGYDWHSVQTSFQTILRASGWRLLLTSVGLGMASILLRYWRIHIAEWVAGLAIMLLLVPAACLFAGLSDARFMDTIIITGGLLIALFSVSFYTSTKLLRRSSKLLRWAAYEAPRTVNEGRGKVGDKPMRRVRRKRRIRTTNSEAS